MGITVKWDNKDETVLCYEVKGQWTLEDVDAAVEETHAMTENITYGVHAIIDIRNSRTIADGVLVYLRKAMRLIPDFDSVICVVTNSTEVRTAVKMYMRIFKPNVTVYMVNSMNSARRKFEDVTPLDARLEAAEQETESLAS